MMNAPLAKLLVVVALAWTSSSSAQNWTLTGFPQQSSIQCFASDSVEDRFFAGGLVPLFGPGQPKSIGQLTSDGFAPLGPNPGIQSASSMAVYENDLYVGGNGIRKWNGATYEPVGQGINGQVNKLVTHEGFLYAFGAFSLIDSVPVAGMARWDGASWTPLPVTNQLDLEVFPIADACWFQNELHICGQIRDTTLTTAKQNIFRLEGDSLKPLGGGITGALSGVWAIEPFLNNLMVGGYFLETDGNPGSFLLGWDGHEWFQLGEGVPDGQVLDLQTQEEALWVGGQFLSAGNLESPYLARWDGSKWCSVGPVFDGIVQALGLHNNQLYVGGNFQTVAGDTCYGAAKWSGGLTATTCTEPLSSQPETVQANHLIISPNPTSSQHIQLNLQGEHNGHLQVWNTQGQLVLSTNVNLPQSTIALPPITGIYLLRLSAGQHSYSTKVIYR